MRSSKRVWLGAALLLLGAAALWLGAMGCKTSSPASADPVMQAEVAAATEDGAACYVGLLRPNKPKAHGHTQDYCADEVHFVGSEHRLGRINVFGLDGGDAPSGYVLLRATPHDDLLAALSRRGACPEDGPFPIQARGDWDHEEGGYYTTQERLRQASYLRAASAKPVELLDIDPPAEPDSERRNPPPAPGAQLKVRVRNPFSFEMSGLTLVVHYEGGRGKPMPRYREHPLPALAVGGEAEHVYPPAVEDNGAWFHYASVSLEGSTSGCTFVSSTYRR